MSSINEFIEEFENLLADEMARMNIPGTSIAIIQGNKLVYSNGIGISKISEAATDETFYPIGSVSKSFTCMAILQLEENGKLNLNDHVNKHIPEFKLGYEDNPITIHHLMSHTSGLHDLGVVGLTINDSITLTPLNLPRIPLGSWNDFFRIINSYKGLPFAKPEERFYYLNEGFTILGLIIEKISGISFEQYIRENIFKPLEMNNSYFFGEVDPDVDRSIGYEIKIDKGKQFAVPNPEFSKTVNAKFLNAAGGIISSVKEMSNYMLYMLNGEYKGVKLLNNPDRVKKFYFVERYPDLMLTSIIGNYGKTGYGYGWFIQDDFHGDKIVLHGGNINGGSAIAAFINEKKLGIVALSNISPGVSSLIISSLAVMLGNKKEDLTVYRIQAHMNKLSGKYATHKNLMSVEVKPKGALLYIEMDGPEPISLPLIPLDADELEPTKYYSPTPVGTKSPIMFTLGQPSYVEVERMRFYKI